MSQDSVYYTCDYIHEPGQCLPHLSLHQWTGSVFTTNVNTSMNQSSVYKTMITSMNQVIIYYTCAYTDESLVSNSNTPVNSTWEWHASRRFMGAWFRAYTNNYVLPRRPTLVGKKQQTALLWHATAIEQTAPRSDPWKSKRSSGKWRIGIGKISTRGSALPLSTQYHATPPVNHSFHSLKNRRFLKESLKEKCHSSVDI